jgi:5'-nucleotidase
MNRRILITNDDGYDAPGLKALVKAFQKHAECFVVAPLSERSASGHAVTLRKSIRVKELKTRGVLTGYAVDGTPADCVKFALKEHYKDNLPDLVVSGINPGPNLGVSVYYSGTIGAAREAVFAHVPAFAISLDSFAKSGFTKYAQWTVDTILKIHSNKSNKQHFYNINIPKLKEKKPRGVRFTHQSHSRFEEEFVKLSKGSRGAKRYQLTGHMEVLKETGYSDDEAVRGGYISVTPCQLDTSDYSEIKRLEKVFKRGKSK